MINIAYSSSEYYFKPSLVSIYSLLKNTDTEVHLFFLSSRVSEGNKHLLEYLVKRFNAKLSIIEVDSALIEFACRLNLPLMRGNYSTYARILLAEILPDIDQIFLIDSDTLIAGDIGGICEYVNTGKIIYSVRDYVISNIHSRHEDLDLRSRSYFNMGVVYIDLKAWRSAGLTELLKTNFLKESKLKIADQSIVNRYLADFIGELPLKYNFYTYFHSSMSHAKFAAQNNNTTFCDEKEFAEAKRYPVIIHFIGTWYERPWFKENLSNQAALYLKYWHEIYGLADLFDTPKRPLISRCYDFLSTAIYKCFGFDAYFWFRYNLVQKMKRDGW